MSYFLFFIPLFDDDAEGLSKAYAFMSVLSRVL